MIGWRFTVGQRPWLFACGSATSKRQNRDNASGQQHTTLAAADTLWLAPTTGSTARRGSRGTVWLRMHSQNSPLQAKTRRA